MKERFILLKLVLLLVITPMVIWFGALSGTVVMYRECRRLAKMEERISDRESQVDLSMIPDADYVTDGSVIAGINRCFANPDLLITSFTPEIGKEESGLLLVTAVLEIKGDYKSLLKVLRYLETGGCYALSDIVFERRDEREKEVSLRLTLSQLVRSELQQ